VILSVSILAALLATGAAYERLAQRRAKRRLSPPGRLIDIGGRCLHLYELGQRPGPTVVIEQGAGSPSLMWWPVQRLLADFARVATYDRAGYLWSDPPAHKQSIDDRVEDLHTLLKNSGLPSPYLFVAHSYGGLLSRRYARRWPEQVAGMVLVDAPPESVLFKPSFLSYCAKGATFQRILAATAQVGLLRLCARWLPMLLLPEDAAAKALCLSPSFMTATGADFSSLVQAPAPLRTAEEPGELGDKPLIVLAHGIPFPAPATELEADWAAGMERNNELSRNSRLIVARKSNHMIHVDEPALVVDAVRRVYTAARTAGQLVA
jgi:pimeloyl-ACP methyl ester carboxylesterase